MRSVDELEHVRGMRVLMRGNLNARASGGALESDYRIRSTLPTLELLRARGARIVLIGHRSGDPKSETFEALHEFLEGRMPIRFVRNVFSNEGRVAIETLQDGEVLLLDNIRQYEEESANNRGFAERLAALADIYVNDDFTVAHRAHASVVTLPLLRPSYAGLQFAREVLNLTKALTPPHPALVIIGGAKPETKLPLAHRFRDHAQWVFVGGVLGNMVLRARGYEIGTSRVGDNSENLYALAGDARIAAHRDAVVKSEKGLRTAQVEDIRADESIHDAGPETVLMLEQFIREAAFVLWNGPLGEYEVGFTEGTVALARLIADHAAYSVVGGGDTVAAIKTCGCEEKFTFISTAGGAMIEFLLRGTLPGVEALHRSPSVVS